MGYYDPDLTFMIGATVKEIFWSEDQIVFVTDKGDKAYTVEGDCCSRSYFFDFYGVRSLLANGPVVAFEAVSLSPGDPGYRSETWDAEGEDCYEVIQVYGYRLTTVHEMWGETSSVLSFRNSSNGYYGGWMTDIDPAYRPQDLRSITEDVVGS